MQDVVTTTTTAALGAGFGEADAARAAASLVALFGSRAPDVFAARADAAPPRLITGTSLPLAAVGFCVREEWAATVDDLVERRLMLAFDPALSAAAIRDVAGELARLGRLPAAAVVATADACILTLTSRYDRRLNPLT
jgi:glycerol-3-phosphate dehydrogenase